MNTANLITLVREAVHDIEVYLALCRSRDDTGPVVARVAADHALKRIDVTTQRLGEIREQLVDEIREYDERWVPAGDS